jgi:hypothetical protein
VQHDIGKSKHGRDPLKPQLITADHPRRSQIARCGRRVARASRSRCRPCCGNAGAVKNVAGTRERVRKIPVDCSGRRSLESGGLHGPVQMPPKPTRGRAHWLGNHLIAGGNAGAGGRKNLAWRQSLRGFSLNQGVPLRPARQQRTCDSLNELVVGQVADGFPLASKVPDCSETLQVRPPTLVTAIMSQQPRLSIPTSRQGNKPPHFFLGELPINRLLGFCRATAKSHDPKNASTFGALERPHPAPYSKRRDSF